MILLQFVGKYSCVSDPRTSNKKAQIAKVKVCQQIGEEQGTLGREAIYCTPSN